MYYFFIVATACLFSAAMLFNKLYQKNEGDSFFKGLIFTLIVNFCGLIMMAGLSKFNFKATPFSLVVALIQAVVSLSYFCLGIKTLQKVDLFLYTLFTMAGGLVLPFLCGIVLGENLTVQKVICMILLIVSMFVSVGKVKDYKGIWLCVIMFFLNGGYGMLSVIHQHYPEINVPSENFSFYTYMFSLIIAIVIFVGVLINKKSHSKPLEKINKPKTSIVWAMLYLVLNGLGNYFLLIFLKSGVHASLQYPIVTGGVIIFNTVFGYFLGEKPNKKTIISIILSFAGLICLLF